MNIFYVVNKQSKLVFFILSILMGGLMLPTKTFAETSIESEILNLSREKFLWKTTGDIDKVENLFDDELVFVHLNGHISNKKEWIDQLRSKNFVYQKIDEKEASVKAYGDTAVLVGKAAFKVKMSAFSNTYDLVYTEVYTKKQGVWKLVNIHTCSY